MSYEINPVLAGTFDAPDYAPAHNIASTTAQASSDSAPASDTTATSSTSDVDSRRYTKFDHSDTEAGTATLSFGDFMDMINPLEHIPVVSSIYRSIEGESINPVSRVVGDVMYGGLLSIPSAVFGGLSSIANASLEAETGKDSSGLMIAALFGPDDKPATTQLADAGKAAAPVASTSTAQATLPAATSPASAPAAMAANVRQPPSVQKFELAQAANTAPIMAALKVQMDNAQTPAATQSAPASAANNQQPLTNAIGGIPVTRNGPAQPQSPFGGAAAMPNMQAQDMAIALSESSPTMRMGHTIYTNRLVNGAHPLPPMLSATTPQGTLPPVVAPAPVALPMGPTSDAGSNAAMSMLGAGAGQSSPSMAGALTGAMQGSPQQGQLPPGFAEDMMIKAMMSRYGTAGANTAGSGSMVNLVN